MPPFDDPAFWKTAALSFSIAAPVGPVGALCMGRCLGGGFDLGLATGIGAASAHMALVIVAASSLSSATLDPALSLAASLAGGLLMLTVGVLTARRSTVVAPRPALRTKIAILAAYLSGALICAANPTTILLFLTVVPAIAAGDEACRPTAGTMAAGAFFGSTLWWLILSTGVTAMRSRLTAPVMRVVNGLAGSMMIAFAVLILSREASALLR